MRRSGHGQMVRVKSSHPLHTVPIRERLFIVSKKWIFPKNTSVKNRSIDPKSPWRIVADIEIVKGVFDMASCVRTSHRAYTCSDVGLFAWDFQVHRWKKRVNAINYRYVFSLLNAQFDSSQQIKSHGDIVDGNRPHNGIIPCTRAHDGHEHTIIHNNMKKNTSMNNISLETAEPCRRVLYDGNIQSRAPDLSPGAFIFPRTHHYYILDTL